jgi:hypothetical protein
MENENNISGAPEASATVAEPTAEQTKNKIAVKASAIVAALLVAGGAYGYYSYTQSPAKIIPQMMEQTAKTDTMEYDGVFNIRMEGGNLLADTLGAPSQKNASSETEKVNVTVNFSGATDITDLNNSKTRFGLNLSITPMPKDIPINSAQFDIVGVAQTAFVKINIPGISYALPFLSDFNNQWIKIDIKELEDQFALSKETEKKDSELSQEQINEIEKTIAEAKMFKVVEKMDSAEINGVNCHHYRYEIDKKETANMVLKIAEIVSKEKYDASDKQEVMDGLNDVGPIAGEIYIGKKDKHLYKMTCGFTYEDGAKQEKIALSFEMTAKNHNKPITIEAPQTYKSAEEVFNALMGQFAPMMGMTADLSEIEKMTNPYAAPKTPGTNPVIGGDLTKDTDKDGLPDDLETMFGLDPQKSDTDGDGINDLEAMENEMGTMRR